VKFEAVSDVLLRARMLRAGIVFGGVHGPCACVGEKHSLAMLFCIAVMLHVFFRFPYDIGA